MAAFSSPMRLVPPLTPHRAPSPTMSPGGRRGRTHGSSEESHLRDLSPETTLRAFTQTPLPFDTRQDEYKIFSCIETLTAAERDLGARVAKAAQRLKTWCTEIEQWGWSGSFEPPSAEIREQRRQSLELRIREHIPDADLTKTLQPLEYWGSLLSDEVEQHDARLDDIEEEMLKLDVEELKEHVLDMHPAGRSRPSSAGFEAVRQNYRPMDDFSFLITQTLLSALPHHAQLKDRLGTWTARVSILREAPVYLAELETAQTAMRLAWDAIEPPTDTSDVAFTQWKEAVGTISDVLQTKVGQLGRRLDKMLDTLEGRQDCLPDSWIDVFEGTEADYGRWAHNSRRRVIEFDIRRRVDKGTEVQVKNVPDQLEPHSNSMALSEPRSAPIAEPLSYSFINGPAILTEQRSAPVNVACVPTSANDIPDPRKSHPLNTQTLAAQSGPPSGTEIHKNLITSPGVATDNHLQESAGNEHNITPKQSTHGYTKPAEEQSSPAIALFARTHTIPNDVYVQGESVRKTSTVDPRDPPKSIDEHAGVTSELFPATSSTPKNPTVSPVPPTTSLGATTHDRYPVINFKDTPKLPSYEYANGPRAGSPSSTASTVDTMMRHDATTELAQNMGAHYFSFEVDPPQSDDDSIFEEGDTVIHNELDDSPHDVIHAETGTEMFSRDKAEMNSADVVQSRPGPLSFSNTPIINTTDGQNGTVLEPPQTPRSRRGSRGSLSSEMSFDSSSPGFVEESPSVRNATNRGARAPRPELNAAMAKRRPTKDTIDDSIVSTPWPPTRFSQKPASSVDDLERKISDILTTIPAHIRLTTGPGADAPEVKSTRSIAAKGSRGYLRAARSISGLKSPELTLSPAKNDYDSASAASGRKSAAAARGDNDIKLYHLTQPGKEHPIKLFIRRVGENGERVMVRVGGGWADLGEYLRQYAEHHGRRTASDGKFEILGLEVKNSDNSPARPESATSKRDRRFSSGRAMASPATTPVKSSGLGFSVDEAPPPMPNITSTPGIAEEASVPSTNSSQRSWQGNEVGLAGPKSKKLDLSGQKLEWIEGMMKQARTVSGSVITTNHTPFQREERGESRSESRSDSRTGSRAGARKSEFGDLGKVGGTKRIFMRGGHSSVSEH